MSQQQIEKEIAELTAKSQEMTTKLEQLKVKLQEEKERVGLKVPGESGHFFCFQQDPVDGKLRADYCPAQHFNGHVKTPQFSSYEQAQDFAEAFQVMIELRGQPGIIKGQDQDWSSYFIYVDFFNGTVIAQTMSEVDSYDCISPIFRSWGSCENAIQTVGSDRIIQAVKTLLFVD